MQRGTYLQLTVLAGVLAFAAGTAKRVHATASTTLPTGWTAADVAKTKPKTPGSTTVDVPSSGSAADTVWTVTGTGGDVWDTADAGFQFAYTTLTGDGGVTARLLTQVGGADTDWSKTGTMLRESTDPAAADAFLSYASAKGGKDPQTFQPSWRVNTGGKPLPGKNPTDSFGFDAPQPLPGTHRVEKGPIWLRTQRQGMTYTHLVSDDGRNWMALGTHDVNIDPSKPVLAGIWASQGGSATPNVVTYDNVSVTSDVIKPNLLPGPTNIMAEPGNGVVLLTFSTVPNGTGYTVYRREVGQTVDQAVLVSKAPTPNGWFIDSTVANGKQYLYFLKTVVPDAANPKKAIAEGLIRSSDVLVAPNVPIPSNLAGVGYQFYYWNTTNPGSVTLDSANDLLTIKSSGSDIWSVADSGSFLAVPVAGDYTITAEVKALPTVVGNTDKFAKAGVMIRDGVSPTDRYGIVFTSAGRDPGVLFEARTNNRVGLADSVPGLVGQSGTAFAKTTFPLWLKLTKAGAMISAAQSFDGTTYTDVGKPVDYGFLPPVTYAGLALTAHKDGAFITAQFVASSVKIQP